MATINVNGKVITGQQIAGYKTSANNLADNLTIWANACAIQTYNGNNNWANDLFSLPAMRLQSGKLSAQGKNVLAYIKAHAPRFHFDSVKGKVVMTGKDTKDGKAFVMTGTKQPLINDAGETVTDFPLTFVEFLNWAKPVKETKAPTLKAATVSGQIEKALEAFNGKTFAGSAEEVRQLANNLKAAFVAFATFADVLEGTNEIDAAKVAELLKSGQAGKSERAGGKVVDAA